MAIMDSTKARLSPSGGSPPAKKRRIMEKETLIPSVSKHNESKTSPSGEISAEKHTKILLDDIAMKRRVSFNDTSRTSGVTISTTQDSTSETTGSGGEVSTALSPPEKNSESFTPAPRQSFPEKLLEVLSSSDQQVQKAIRWMPEGDSFVVNTDVFPKTVLRSHFDGTKKYDSFTRKLNRWGFKRQKQQPLFKHLSAYHHPLFKRDSPELSKKMTGTAKHSPFLTVNEFLGVQRFQNNTIAGFSPLGPSTITHRPFAGIPTLNDSLITGQPFLQERLLLQAQQLGQPYPNPGLVGATENSTGLTDALRAQQLLAAAHLARRQTIGLLRTTGNGLGSLQDHARANSLLMARATRSPRDLYALLRRRQLEEQMSS